MSSTSRDLVFDLAPAPASEPGALREMLSMAADVFPSGPPAGTMIERVEAALYTGLFLSAMVVASYGLSVSW